MCTLQLYFLTNVQLSLSASVENTLFCLIILQQCNGQEVYSYSSLIGVTPPAEQCDMFALHCVVSLTMDELESWRRDTLAFNVHSLHPATFYILLY